MERFQLFSRRSDEHVTHKQCVVGSSTDDSNVDSVSLVPASISVDDINAISCIEIIDSSFSVDFPDLLEYMLDFGIDEIYC